MKKRYFVWGLLAALLIIGSSSEAQAQRPAHYYPARPTFSPYLFYRQFNATGLPNYYTQIRPANRFYQEFVARSRAAPRIEARQTLIGERHVAEIVENQLRQRATTGIGQPSIPAQFMDTSHYYPATPIRRR